MYLDEISDLFASPSIKPGYLLITGDFNIRVDTPENPAARRFLDIVGSFRFRQHVIVLTYVAGHTLDLAVTSHSTVLFTLDLPKPTCRTVTKIAEKQSQ